jgi:hypothetical protein
MRKQLRISEQAAMDESERERDVVSCNYPYHRLNRYVRSSVLSHAKHTVTLNSL